MQAASHHGGASASAAGAGFPHSAFMDAQPHVARIDYLAEADVGALGEAGVAAEFAAHLGHGRGSNAIDKDHAVRVAHG